jgi:alkylated DNA repair protein (DNA oxidative demethylase)
MTRLFDDAELQLGPGAVLLRGFAGDEVLLDAVQKIAAAAPFRRMVTPGGYRMSVEMTNCGELGWVTDRSGYRYSPFDPQTGAPWPPMPSVFQQLASAAADAAGFAGFAPDACLVNRYLTGAKLSPHQDRDERDFSQPIVSVSLGAPATFQFGGPERSDKLRRIRLEHGDVVVWGGASRLAYHGVLPLKEGPRINLTFRCAG